MRGAVLITVLLIAALAVPSIALASDHEGDTNVGEAKVTVGAGTVSITSFAWYTDNSYSTSTTQFDPQTDYYLKISVATTNLLRDVVIHFDLFADTNNTAVGTPPASTSPETYVYFEISYSGTDWVLNANTGDSSTWLIEFDNSQSLPSPDASSGDFYLHVVWGKTAREANTVNPPYADWDAIAKGSTDGGNNWQTPTTAYGYTVYFYSEVTTDVSGVDFGTIVPGSHGPIQNINEGAGYSAGSSIPITVIANGYYNIKVTTDSTWTHEDGQHTIALTTGTPGDGQFALKADNAGDADGNPTNEHVVGSDLTSSEGLLTSIDGDSNNPTTESGVNYNIYMEIYLGNAIAQGTYTGSLTITIVNDDQLS